MNKLDDESKVTWDYRFNQLLGSYLPQGLIRACVWSNSLNDEAHNLQHVYGVCQNAFTLIDKMGLEKHQIPLVVAGCLMHDLGCRYDRTTHHFISYGMAFSMLEMYAPGVFSPEDTMLIAQSCLEHRASYKGELSSDISRAVALADRGPPDINVYIRRAVQYRKAYLDDRDIVCEEVYAHMLDKFAPGVGYCWESYPAFGKLIYQAEWDVFNEILLDQSALLDAIKTDIDKYLLIN